MSNEVCCLYSFAEEQQVPPLDMVILISGTYKVSSIQVG